MASTKAYLTFVLDQLSELEGVTYRAMMGEYILYYCGRVFGGIYDDRLLVKPVPAACAMLPHAPMEKPYPGGREMLLVDSVEDRALLHALVEAMYDQLPTPGKRKGRG